eukprot:3611269-Rhodomonas_salina.2
MLISIFGDITGENCDLCEEIECKAQRECLWNNEPPENYDFECKPRTAECTEAEGSEDSNPGAAPFAVYGTVRSHVWHWSSGPG